MSFLFSWHMLYLYFAGSERKLISTEQGARGHTAGVGQSQALGLGLRVCKGAFASFRLTAFAEVCTSTSEF